MSHRVMPEVKTDTDGISGRALPENCDTRESRPAAALVQRPDELTQFFGGCSFVTDACPKHGSGIGGASEDSCRLIHATPRHVFRIDVFANDGVALRQRDVADATVAMLEVVPAHEIVPPAARVFKTGKAVRREFMRCNSSVAPCPISRAARKHSMASLAYARAMSTPPDFHKHGTHDAKLVRATQKSQ